jgi:RNA-binding protein
MNLTGKQKRFLRAHGHGLKPTVWIGKLGVELTVLRLLDSCPLGRNECAAVLARESGAGVAQILGHTILLYRPHPQHPELELPRARRPDELDIDEDDL